MYNQFMMHGQKNIKLVLYSVRNLVYNIFLGSAWRWLYKRSRNMLLLKTIQLSF